MAKVLFDNIKAQLKENNGKISKEFIDNLAEDAECLFLHPTSNMRLCILKLYSGHEVLGMAQVLDAKNDDEVMGNKVAYDRAVDELWNVCGAIAKVV